MTKLLIANRGEIAVRIIRAAKQLGISTVAVYSTADREALHVKMADEAHHIGPAPSRESYLNQEKILAAAKKSGVTALHPGYGFLSENAGFARKVIEAGITWVGPNPEAMDKMGDKVSARAEAEAAGVPVAPGSTALKDAKDALAACKKIGFPVILKASAGGGGMGMRVVWREAEVAPSFKACQDQAASAFGVPDVFAEKYLTKPRHIEVQILADKHGNVLHLFERECSIQRRNQKLVEEAPSPTLTQKERDWIGERAVELAKRVGYDNAGTMEFLYQDGALNFNEMNTRIQVEHPVTEMITGIDLVSWQIRVALGEKLSMKQQDVKINGHAIELRINAEDPDFDFRPSPGPVGQISFPSGDGIRVDSYLQPNYRVPESYDSMVAKIIAHGDDRIEAIDKALDAVRELELEGLTTNWRFHEDLLLDADFRGGEFSTRFLEENVGLGKSARIHLSSEEANDLAAIVQFAIAKRGGGLPAIAARQRRPEVA